MGLMSGSSLCGPGGPSRPGTGAVAVTDRGFTLLLVAALALLAGCASRPYEGQAVAGSSFLQRALTQEYGPVRVTAAVPDDAETAVLTGLDLYEQGIQPVWLEVENRGTKPLRIALWSIDRDYYAPIEVAYMNRKPFSADGYAAMERWFYDNGLQRTVPPGESRSGLVFTHRQPGTKGFNLDIFSNRVAHSFTFFVPMPGFTADYMEVDFANLYAGRETRQLDPDSLKTLLEEELPCCVDGRDSGTDGGPINVVMVGTPLAVRRSLLRGGWHETVAGSMERARSRHFLGRKPDAIFYRDRADGDERIQISLWRAPWDVDGEPGWVGQVYYFYIDDKFFASLREKFDLQDPTFLSMVARESVVADVDSAQRFLLQNFWYNQSVRKVGIVTGVGISTPEQPRVTADGIAYFTDGTRTVLFLSETPVALDKTEVLYDRRLFRRGAQP
jgi:hypothetical protein